MHIETRVKAYHPVYIADYPFADSLNNRVRPLLENYKGGIGHTNVKATHTEWQWGMDIPEMKKFAKYILAEVDRYAECKLIDKTVYRPRLTNLWANIYEKGDSAQQHNHMPNFMSFAYFVKAKWYDSPFILTDSGKKVRPKEGRFCLFPDYMNHAVPKHRYKHQRITLSGNIDMDEVKENPIERLNWFSPNGREDLK